MIVSIVWSNGRATAVAIKKIAADFISLTAGTNEAIDEITSLANGSFVVTSHRSSSTGLMKYFTRVYDSTHTLISGPAALNGTAYASFSNAKLTKVLDLGDGTYWVLWNAPSQTGSTSPTVMSQHFAADNTRIGNPVEQTLFNNLSSPLPEAIVATGDTATPFAWAAVKTVGGVTNLTLTLLDPNFAAQGNEISLNESLASDARISGIEVLTSGKLLVSFIENKSTTASDKLSVVILDVTSGTFAAPVLVTTGAIFSSEIDVNANGSFVVTYRKVDTSRPNDIKVSAAIFDSAGTLLATADQITNPEPVFGNDYETVLLDNDRFATIWVTADHADSKKTVLFLQFYDAEGLTISNEILLGYVPRQSAGINLHAELNEAGKLVVNWIGLSGTTQVKKSAVFDPRIFVATSGIDWWTGGDANETFRGAAGNDELLGKGGNDKLYGDNGNDTLFGGAGADVLDGGVGDDTASYYGDEGVTASLLSAGGNLGAAAGDTYASIERLAGSNSGNDVLEGNRINNIIWGYGGTDNMRGGDGNDLLLGGAGGDYLDGENGQDWASYYEDAAVTVNMSDTSRNTGAARGDYYVAIENLEGSNRGNDRLTGDSGFNEIYGQGGNDFIYSQEGDDNLNGGSGDDTVSGGEDQDSIAGEAGNDRLYGNHGDDTLTGGTGADYLNGGIGFDFVDYFGGSSVIVSLSGSFANGGAATGDTFAGIEGVYGTSKGADKISGSNANNDLFGNGGNDKLYGLGGNDYLSGELGADLLDGGSGEDTASYYSDGGVTVALDRSIANKGAAAIDTLISIENLSGSNRFDDVLIGNAVDNYLRGNGGNDRLVGNGGDDGLKGGIGKDILEGGAGKDYFVYSDQIERGDKIVDFEKDDSFSFSNEMFTSFSFTNQSFLNATYFQSGTTNVASGTTKLFIFRTTDDTLWVDFDGKGGAAALLFADFQNDYNLKASDIFIY